MEGGREGRMAKERRRRTRVPVNKQKANLARSTHVVCCFYLYLKRYLAV